MRPDLVVDIGNSRIKWGRCESGRVTEKMASLVGDNPDEWQSQLRVWQLTKHLVWAVAGVQHHWQARFLQWAESRGDTIHSITREQIPIPIDVD